MIPQYKKNKLKELKKYNLADYVQSSWTFNGGHQLYVEGFTVHLNCAIQKGTSTAVFVLPKELRPKKAMFFGVTTADSSAYIQINENGTLYINQANVGKLIFINISYLFI